MRKITIEKILKISGLSIFIIGLYVSIIIGLEHSDCIYFVIGALICFFVGLFFVALGEIISLLRENLKKQDEIVAKLNQKGNK